MLLRPKLLRFIGTSLLSYIWVAAAISVTPASAADEIDFRNHSSKELITNQFIQESQLVNDIKSTISNILNMEVGNRCSYILIHSNQLIILI